MPCPKKPLLLAENFTSLRLKLPDPSLKSINKTYICKNKTNIYINKTIICTNITFIYTFLRSAAKNPPRWSKISAAVAMISPPDDDDGDDNVDGNKRGDACPPSGKSQGGIAVGTGAQRGATDTKTSQRRHKCDAYAMFVTFCPKQQELCQRKSSVRCADSRNSASSPCAREWKD